MARLADGDTGKGRRIGSHLVKIAWETGHELLCERDVLQIEVYQMLDLVGNLRPTGTVHIEISNEILE